MNIVVLVKQVPAISNIEIDATDHNLVRVGAPSMLNPIDVHAIEAALSIKATVGGTVTLIAMGTALAGEGMRNGIAMGADAGILLSDAPMAGSDTLATGKILAKAIAKFGGVDLVLTGKQSADGDTGQIPPAVAQRLGLPLISYAESVTVEDHVLKTTRKNHNGIETVEAVLPAVCSVVETANTPRTPSIKGKLAAKKAVFQVWTLEDLGLRADEVGKAGSATKVTELFAPEPHTVGIMVDGKDEIEACRKLMAILASEKVI